MGVFDMVVVIVVVGCVTGMVSSYFKSKRDSGTSTDDTQNQIDELEQRIEVLERVITSDRSELRREIDGL